MDVSAGTCAKDAAGLFAFSAAQNADLTRRRSSAPDFCAARIGGIRSGPLATDSRKAGLTMTVFRDSTELHRPARCHNAMGELTGPRTYCRDVRRKRP
jgi:hypothetical protein